MIPSIAGCRHRRVERAVFWLYARRKVKTEPETH